MYTHKGIVYRPCTKEDIIGLTFFCFKITKEKELTGVLEPNFEVAAKNLGALLEENQGVTLIALKDDIIVGCLVLGKTNLWWTDSTFFTDLIFFVDPEFRKNYGIQETLIEKAKTFADLAKTPIILSIFDLSNRKEAIMKYLNKRGFKTVSISGLYLPK